MSKVSDRTLIVSMTFLALLLRAWGMNSDLWLDEISSLVSDMRAPLFEVITQYRAANQHLLNSVLGSLSILLFGEAAWTVRLPALLFGVATVPFFFTLARRVTTRREAIFATLFLVISYHHIWFSQNARGYSAMIFFTVVSTGLMLRRLESRHIDTARGWGLFALVSALGMLSVLNYAFVLIGQFVTAAAILANGHHWRAILRLLIPAVFVVALSVLAYAMMLPDMFAYFSAGGSDMGWQDPWLFIEVMLEGLTGSLTIAVVPGLLLGAVFMGAGGVSYLRSQRLIPLVPLLAVGANLAALIILDFGAYPRSFLYVLPFAALILMRGAFLTGQYLHSSAAGNRYAQNLEYLVPGLILVAALAMLPHLYRFPKQDYSGALAWARLNASPSDKIAVVGYLAYGYQAYFAPDLEFPKTAGELDQLNSSGRRVWLLYSFSRDMRRHFPDINQYMEGKFCVRQTFPGTLGDGAIYVADSQGKRTESTKAGGLSRCR